MNKRAPKDKKISRVASLSDLIKSSKAIGIADYKGMNVAQATQIRNEIKKVGGEVKIEKNTLFKLALGMKDLQLDGLSAFVFSKTDEISALKAMADFAKKNNILAFKAGVMGDRLLSASEVLSLANTPAKETSVGKLLFLLNYNISKLVRTLDAIRSTLNAKSEVTN